MPPSFDELEKRLYKRDLDSKEVISKRLENAITEIKSAELFDYIVLNDEFSKTIEILSAILFEDNFQYNNNDTEKILKELLDK